MGWWGEERALKWGRIERSRGRVLAQGRESAGAQEGGVLAQGKGERGRKGKESEGARGRRARAHREGERAYFFLYIILTGW